MRVAVTIAAKDLRQRVRDRSAILIGIVAPLVLAGIISAALGGGVSSFHTSWAVYDGDHGPLAQALGQVLRAPQLARVVHVRPVASAAEATALTRRQVDAAILIPPGFSAAAVSGPSGQLEPLHVVRSRAALLGGQLAAEVARGFVARVEATGLAVRTALAAGATRGEIGAIVARTGAAPPPVALVDASAGGRALKPAAYFGPAMAMFFLFFSVGFGARSLLAERTRGTLARLRVAPISPAAVLAGKAMASFVIGMVSMLTLVVASSVLLGAQWGEPLPVLALVVGAVLATMGITTLVVTLARTEDQAAAYGSAVALVLSLVGGNFFPIALAPAVLRRITLLTPNGWALRGFTDLGTGGKGLSVVGLSLVALFGFTVVTGTVGVARSRRMVGL